MLRRLVTIQMAVLAIAMFAGMTGCQSVGPDGPDNNPPEKPVPTPDPDTENPKDDPDGETPDPDGENPEGENPNDQNPDPKPDPENPDTDKPGESPKEKRFGTWHKVSGTALDYYGDGSGFRVEYLTLDSNGVMNMYMRSPSTNVVFCEEGVFTFPSADSMIIQTYEADLVRTEQSSEEFLMLKDSQGGEGVFAREDFVPDNNQCKTLNIVKRDITQEWNHSGYGDLAFDGTSLWYRANNSKYREFDPVLEKFYEPIYAPSNHSNLQAIQGKTFWASCECQSETLAVRRTQTGVMMDDVSTTELGLEAAKLTTHAMAYDDDEDVAWLFVKEDDVPGYRFLKVDTNAEPDVLLEDRKFDLRIDALTFDGAYFWGVHSNYRIVQIDPETLRAVATFSMPSKYDYPYKIAAFGNRLFILGVDYTGDHNEDLFAVAVTDTVPAKPDKPAKPDDFDPHGVWELTDGTILVDESGRSISVMDIREDDTVEIVYYDPQTYRILCFEGTATIAGEELTLYFDEVQGIEDITVIKTFSVTPEQGLQLDGSNAEASTFVRRRAIPDRFSCKKLEEVKTAEVRKMPGSWTGLAFDGTSLWFSSSPTEIVAVDPETGEITSSNGFPTERYVHDVEGADFWTMVLGPVRKMQRVTAGDVVADELDAPELTVYAASRDPDTGELWASGFKAGTNEQKLACFNVAEEPDVEIKNRDFPLHMNSFVAEGGYLWGLTGSKGGPVVQISQDAFKVVATYQVPESNVTWSAITMIDGHVYLVGREFPSTTGVLMELEAKK